MEDDSSASRKFDDGESKESTKIRLRREKNLVSDLSNKILKKKGKEFICISRIYRWNLDRVNQTVKFDLS